MWLVDPDRPPRLPVPLRPLARFARGHFTGDQPSLRAGLDAYLAGHGIDLEGRPVVMLPHARVLGYVFNPITLYWCHGPDGDRRCVVAEVHNTYGGRHAYLLDPDETGTAHADKEFYVSPFLPVDGRYRMRLPRPGPRLDLTVHLDREDGRTLTATVHGTRRAVTVPNLLRLTLPHPWSTLAGSAAIRFHGIRLHLRGLAAQPRPEQHTPGEPDMITADSVSMRALSRCKVEHREPRRAPLPAPPGAKTSTGERPGSRRYCHRPASGVRRALGAATLSSPFRSDSGDHRR